MVEAARACGATAKFAGSGGAIVGTYEGDAMFERVRTSLAAIGSRTIKPNVSGD
jgi:glucuronokinase